MPILHLSALPSKESVVFESSSFFVHHAVLPTPNEVRHAVTTPPPVDPGNWFVVRFPSLRLIVKYGRHITIAEGQCLWAMRKLLGNTVPVPEVYGWCRDGDSKFLYMELIEAPTLKERWNTLLASEREEIGKQFGQMVENIRRLELPPSVSFVGAHSLLLVSVAFSQIIVIT
jgi:aminoglycoside phosphotransferase (APT) family kinase protein